MKLTAQDLIDAISKLPQNRQFAYFNAATKSVMKIEGITRPEGPIYFKRYNPSTGQTPQTAKVESISRVMLSRVANAIKDGIPINIDRILGASYNTRSALESLLGYTPQFSFCFPGRIEVGASTTTVQRGHKHLVWLPNNPHKPGFHHTVELNVTISEMPSAYAIYEAIVLPESNHDSVSIDENIKRIHAQMQVALVEIAVGMGCKTYVAKNDQGIKVKNTPLAQHVGVLTDLSDQKLLSNFPDATKAGALIDCIWFKNGKHMPAVLEVEYTTGITSGLTRMLNFQDNSPSIVTRYIIAAPDDDRGKVLNEFQKIQFQKMKPSFLPFSAIHELYALTQRGRLKGVSPDIIDNFMEHSNN